MSASSRFTLLPAAVTGLAVAAGAKASASVIYSGPINETFTSTPLTLDLDSDGNSDVSMTVVTNYPEPDFALMKPSFTGQNNALVSGSYSQLEVTSSGVSAEEEATNTSSYGSTDSGIEYVGVKIASVSGTTPLYGWAEYNYDGASTGTLLGYAYDNSGADIDLGQTSAVPEPSAAGSAAGAVALLAGSVVLWRRRKAAVMRAA